MMIKLKLTYVYHSLEAIFEVAATWWSTVWGGNDEICNGESETIALCWGGGSDSEIIILIGGAGLRNLVVGMMEHLQSGQVEFDCSQWCIQSIWNTCLQ